MRSCGLGLLPTVIWPQVSQNDTHFGSARADAKEDRQDQTRQRQITQDDNDGVGNGDDNESARHL